MWAHHLQNKLHYKLLIYLRIHILHFFYNALFYPFFFICVFFIIKLFFPSSTHYPRSSLELVLQTKWQALINPDLVSKDERERTRAWARILNDVRGLRSNKASVEADVNACSNKNPGVRGCAEADLSACYNQPQLGVSVLSSQRVLSQVKQTQSRDERRKRRSPLQTDCNLLSIEETEIIHKLQQSEELT